MFDPDQYALLDFGNETKTERFGSRVICRQTPSVADSVFRSTAKNLPGRRPSPARPSPDTQTPAPALTAPELDLSYHLTASSAHKGQWWSGQEMRKETSLETVQPWTVHHLKKRFLLKPTPAGQVGIFPEQAENWDWIETKSASLAGLKGLNLFGYTGGTTLSLASQGASLVHLDASQSAVRWARQNAELSGLQHAPIRWIVEDALKFVAREFNRGVQYDILVADPPTYGKGPKRESWKIEEDLDSLLNGLKRIAASNLKMLIFSCHSPGFDELVLQRLLGRYFDFSHGLTQALPLNLRTADGRSLACGHSVRYLARELCR